MPRAFRFIEVGLRCTCRQVLWYWDGGDLVSHVSRMQDVCLADALVKHDHLQYFQRKAPVPGPQTPDHTGRSSVAV